MYYDSAICRQGKKCKKHGGFPTEVSNMARNMKMELLTFSLILYQWKNCGHRIHVLLMMYDVYWYCQMKKNEWLWKFWKRNDLCENLKKKEGSREKGGGRRKRNPCPMRLCFWQATNCRGNLRQYFRFMSNFPHTFYQKINA